MLALAALLALSAPTPQNGAVPLPGPLRHAGTYHAATGVLTPGPRPNHGPFEVRYANTASPTTYVPTTGPTGSVPGGVITDTGVIIGDFGPPIDSPPGFDTNRIDTFRFAYCDLDLALGQSSWEIEFRSRLAPCEAPTGPADYTIELTGLPSGGCWTVEIDLTGAPEFCLGSEGADFTYDNDPALDSFGWSVRYTGQGTAPAGAVLAGDPSATDSGYVNPNTLGATNPPAPASSVGAGTFFNPFISGCNDGARLLGSGLGTPDRFRIDPPLLAGPGSCIDGAYVNSTGACGAAEVAFSGLYMELDAAESCDPICNCDLCTPVPCVAGQNSTGLVGEMEVSGSLSVAMNDTTLAGVHLPPGQFGIFLHATQTLGPSVPLGDGFLCLGSPGRFDEPLQIQQVDTHGRAEISTATGLLDLSALPIGSAPFTLSANAGVTSYFAFWHRDATQAGFNFARACAVTWQP